MSRFLPIRSLQDTTDPLATALNFNQTQILMYNVKAPIPIAKVKQKVETIKLERILDAPNIIDDYYTELLSWNTDNVVAIGLQDTVYLWNGHDGTVETLELDHPVRVVHWMGKHLVVCTSHFVFIVDDLKMIQQYKIKNISTCSSHKTLLSLGDIEGTIHMVDTRDKTVTTFSVHDGTCCGLAYKKSGDYLLTGGNDNFANIWDCRMDSVMITQSHLAAVKAVTWCPYDSSFVATGGGTMDKSILCWNPLNGRLMQHLYTDSQVTSLSFANKNLISTHGFPNNELRVWTPQKFTQQYKQSTPIYGMESDSTGTIELSYNKTQWPYRSVVAHTDRVLHSAISPDESICCTLSPDGNLKFWKMCSPLKKQIHKNKKVRLGR